MLNEAPSLSEAETVHCQFPCGGQMPEKEHVPADGPGLADAIGLLSDERLKARDLADRSGRMVKVATTSHKLKG